MDNRRGICYTCNVRESELEYKAVGLFVLYHLTRNSHRPGFSTKAHSSKTPWEMLMQTTTSIRQPNAPLLVLKPAHNH